MAFIIIAFLIVGVEETLFHVPGLEAMGALGFSYLGTQLSVLCGGIVLFAALTVHAMKRAVQNFEMVDL